MAWLGFFTVFLIQLTIGLAWGCTDGEFASDPSDCNKYLVCNHGKFIQMSCSSGLHWNQNAKACDWPQNAGCETDGGGKSTSTTTRRTTTTTKRGPKTTTTTTESDSETSTIQPPPSSGQKLICYFTDWSWYRRNEGKYSPDNIEPTLCTHIVYGFILLDSDYKPKIADPWADIDNKFYEKVTSLKSRGVKVSVAIGGWTDSAGGKYSQLVNDPAKRSSFVSSVVQFIKDHNFDGLDLDWEYPKCWQGSCESGPDSDKEGFASLVRELRRALPPGAMLSAAVSASKTIIPKAYDVKTLSSELDWIGVMNYDYHGSWDGQTGHHAPLYYKAGDKIDYFNIDTSIKVWKELGADPTKLIMGIPFYGKSFTLSNAANNGLNAPSSGGGDAGPYTGEAGTLAYYEICKNRDWTVVQDPEKKIGPYAYKGNQWVGYDDIGSIKQKVNYIKSNGLAGAMVWALDFDDFNNICGGGKYPLLKTIKQGLF